MSTFLNKSGSMAFRPGCNQGLPFINAKSLKPLEIASWNFPSGKPEILRPGVVSNNSAISRICFALPITSVMLSKNVWQAWESRPVAFDPRPHSRGVSSSVNLFPDVRRYVTPSLPSLRARVFRPHPRSRGSPTGSRQPPIRASRRLRLFGWCYGVSYLRERPEHDAPVLTPGGREGINGVDRAVEFLPVGPSASHGGCFTGPIKLPIPATPQSARPPNALPCLHAQIWVNLTGVGVPEAPTGDQPITQGYHASPALICDLQ